MDMSAEGAASEEGAAAGTAIASADSNETSPMVAGGWKGRESLWVGLAVFLLGIIGQILLYVIPSEDFATNSSYADYQMIGSLRVCAEGAMYLGAVWAGVYLARWGLRRSKD